MGEAAATAKKEGGRPAELVHHPRRVHLVEEARGEQGVVQVSHGGLDLVVAGRAVEGLRDGRRRDGPGRQGEQDDPHRLGEVHGSER